MILRDLSFWTLVKLSLFLTMLIPLVFILILIPLVLLDVPNVTLSATGEELPKLFGIMGFSIGGPPLWVSALLVGIINLLATCKALQLIARYTPIGKIRIGTTFEGNNYSSK